MGNEEQGTRDREPAGVVHRSHGFACRSLDPETRSIEVIASSETLDSHDEVVEQKWSFKRYAQNPVILWAHNKAQGHNGLPIGRGEDFRVVETKSGPQLTMRIVFASEKANPFAQQVWESFQEGTLRAVSVGFRPHDVRMEKRAGDEVFVLSDNELYELSVVPVGSNPDAVAKSVDSISHLKDAARARAKNYAAQPAEESTQQMDAEKEVKDLRVALEESRAETKAAGLEAKGAQDRIKELEKSNVELVAERDALKGRAEKAESKVIAVEVEALVGKKITPAQRDKFIKLRSTQGEKEFAEFVADMPELPLLKSVTGDDKDTQNHAKSGGTPRKLAERLSKVGS
jgi:HK97 family phage prohead protease